MKPQWESIPLDDFDRIRLQQLYRELAMAEIGKMKSKEVLQQVQLEYQQYTGAIKMLEHLIEDIVTTFDKKYGTEENEFNLDTENWVLTRMD